MAWLRRPDTRCHPGGLWLYIRLRGAADGVQQRDSYLPASCHRWRITGNTGGAAAAPWIGLARDSSGQPVTSAEPHVDRRARTPGPAGSKWPGRYRVEMVDHLDTTSPARGRWPASTMSLAHASHSCSGTRAARPCGPVLAWLRRPRCELPSRRAPGCAFAVLSVAGAHRNSIYRRAARAQRRITLRGQGAVASRQAERDQLGGGTGWAGRVLVFAVGAAATAGRGGADVGRGGADTTQLAAGGRTPLAHSTFHGHAGVQA